MIAAERALAQDALISGTQRRAKQVFDAEHAGCTLLSIDVQSAHRAGRLTAQHRDPFDRMIATRALASDIPILSADSRLGAFGIRRIWREAAAADE
jgi:PIN domain nuclease of toxin-antitoxin system